MPTEPVDPQNEPLSGYRAVSFRDEVMYSIASLLNVARPDQRQETWERWAQRANSHLRQAWESFPFRELEVIEERAFRQYYSPLLNYTAGVEVYDGETEAYYIALEDADVDESPTDAPDKWSALTVYDRYIARDQFGKQRIGDMLGVYMTDPRSYWQSGLSGYTVPWVRSNRGYDLTTWSGNTVFICYRPEQPVFSGKIYDEETSYPIGAVAYWPGETGDEQGAGECYLSLTDANTGNSPEEQAHWLQQRFPYALSEYVTHMVASDFAEDAQTKAILAAAAERAWRERIDRELIQGTRFTWANRRGGSYSDGSGIPVTLYPVPTPVI